MLVFKRTTLAVSFALIFFACSTSATFAARLYLSPSNVSLSPGEQATITIYADANGTAINSAEVNLSFPVESLQVESLSKSGSIFSMWIEEPQFSNTSGTVHFNGGLPSPGYSGSSGKLASLRVTAKKAGNVTLSFANSSVTANDGLGTDVLASKASTQITIANAEPAKPQTVKPSPATTAASVTTLAITSGTHPDQNGWYTNKDPVFSLQIPTSAVAMRLSIAEDPEEKPGVLYRPPISEKTVTSLDDGIWYFRAQTSDDKKWSSISTYVVRIDTQAPKWLSFAAKSILATGQEFTVVATDTLSGIDHYEITLDNGKAERANLSPDGLYTMRAAPGDHTLYAVAYDKAGNKTSNTFSFTVPQPIEGSQQEIPSSLTSFAGRLSEINKVLLAVVEFVGLVFLLLFIIIMGTKKLLSMRPVITQIEEDLFKDHSSSHSKSCSNGTCDHEEHQVLRAG